MGEHRHSEEVERQLPSLREDCRRVIGTPFKHFLCPILLEDEPVPLCMGHIINEACPNSFSGCVVQRSDIDGFYGSLVESDFTTNIQARSVGGLEKALRDPAMRKKLGPKLTVDGEELEYYEYREADVPGHTPINVHIGEGEPLRLVVKKTQEELDALMDKKLEISVGKDCRLSAVVTLVKAAFLTLFRLLGYSYAVSPEGRRIGQHMLGQFYREHGSNNGRKKIRKARREAPAFFEPFVNIMRLVDWFDGRQSLGTVEDKRGMACMTASGKIFGLKIFVRTDIFFGAVLMPFYEEAEGEAAYNEFLQSDSPMLLVRECEFEDMRLQIGTQSKESFWPKNDEEFKFD
jgi:hypothetical protein